MTGFFARRHFLHSKCCLLRHHLLDADEFQPARPDVPDYFRKGRDCLGAILLAWSAPAVVEQQNAAGAQDPSVRETIASTPGEAVSQTPLDQPVTR